MLKKALAASAIAAAAAGVLLTGAPAMADNVFTSGNGSVLSGNQAVVDANAPINICGNAVAVLGVAGANCTDSGAAVYDW